MTRGKIAVQVAHGAVSAAEKARTGPQEVWRAWMREGQKKVAVKVNSEEAILDLERRAIAEGLPRAVIRDAGMTELPPGTVTVIGLGPARSNEIDKITGDLKLL
ncbi:peptidyl-tRNA hydrolase [Candidatus Thorarchaeota archaeon]|nr:MAG: peptidyl-tRNA hydrolase [Candidatus Thorarchaeota archaeon]